MKVLKKFNKTDEGLRAKALDFFFCLVRSKQNNILPTVIFAVFLTVFSGNAYAVCPVCTIAVGAGVGISRWLGIDDTISGLWIGGLIISSGLWLASWIEKKYKSFKYLDSLSVLAMFLITIVPLSFTDILWHPLNTILGMDKIIFGTILGAFVFTLSVFTDRLLRKTNNEKVYVPFQRVILPLCYLLVGSLIMYLITK